MSCCSSSTPWSARPRPTSTSCKLLRKSGKPVFLVANKIDDARHEPEAAAAVEPRTRRAVPGLGDPRPRCRRPARRDHEGAAGRVGGRQAGDRRPAPRRDPRSPERRQVVAAEQGRGRRARRRQRARRHHPRPRRRDRRPRRQAVAVRRHRRHPSSRAPAAGRRLLRVAAHLGRAREGRSRRRRARRVASRSASRTCASSTSCSSRAARSCSRSTSGTA